MITPPPSFASTPAARQQARRPLASPPLPKLKPGGRESQEDIGNGDRATVALRSASRAESTTTMRTGTTTVRFGSTSAYDADYDDESDEDEDDRIDGTTEADHSKNWLDLDTRISTPDSALLISPPQSPSIPTLRQGTSTRASSNGEDLLPSYHSRMAPSDLGDTSLCMPHGLAWRLPKQRHAHYQEPPLTSDGESRSPSDETVRRPDYEKRTAGETSLGQALVDKTSEHGYDEFDAVLMNMVMEGIGRMSVTMRMDGAGRWRIARRKSDESFVAEDFL
ncbi:hypothetical protein GQ53DRAFT_228184 [Thozetella sp. PMI_491]|nr:hypothetical protein GQ53DRAFT_228184 [Thozetella sp. PMI_491]